MTNLIEINKYEVKIDTLEKGTNTYPIKILPTNKSLEASEDEGFKRMAPDTSIPYRHSNYIGHEQTSQRKNQYAKLSNDPTLLSISSSM